MGNLVNPYIHGALNTDIFYDNFNDNSLDGAKWDILNSTSGFSYNETNQRMEVAISGGTNGVDALVTANSYDITDRVFQVEAIDILNTVGASTYFVAIDAGGDYFGFVKNFGTNLSMEYNVAGSPNFTPVTYDSTNHRYLRLRHSTLHDALYWEASADAITWTILRTVSPAPSGIDLTALKFRLQCNLNTATPLTQIWDNVRLFDYTAPAWSFDDIPYIVSRFTAASISASDGDPIGTIPDLIGSNDGTSAGSDRPLYRTGGGTPYLEFDGTRRSVTGVTNAFGDFTVIVVADLFTMAAAKRVIDKNFSSGFWMGRNPSTAGEIGSGIRESAPPYGAFHAFTNGNRYCLLVAREGTTGRNWLNSSHASRTVSSSALNSDPIVIGDEVATGGNGIINFYEMIVVAGVISSGNWTEINSYLSSTYGVSF